MIHSIFRLTLALVLVSAARGTQQPPAPPVPLSKAETPLLDADGRPLVAGELPRDASAEARTAWEQICAASLVPGETRRPVTAFDLELDIVYKASEAQTNDVPSSRYRYSQPGWVRLTTGKGRELLRGPAGDWLLDPGRNEKTQLEIGRQNTEDRRQLDDTLGIARNFIALTDPRSLRIASLRTITKPKIALPELVASSATRLVWLELRTPDFRAANAGNGAQPATSSGSGATIGTTIARVQLGIDPKTFLVALAVVDQDEAKAGLRGTTILLALDTSVPIDGFQVPTHIRVFEVGEGTAPPAFRAEPSSDIWLIATRSRLRPEIAPDVFKP